MSWRTVVSHVSENARRHGWPAALHDLECRALNRVARFEALEAMAVRLADVPDPALFEAPGFTGRFVEAGALEAVARAGTHELDPEFLRQAQARGDRCYALFTGDELASYGWYSRRPTPIDEHFVLHFDPAYTYMYKGYTLPAHRGKRLHAVGMCRALRAFTGEGQAGLVSYVLSNNFPSLKSVARMGYRIFGRVRLFGAAGRYFAHASRGCRAYGFWVSCPT
jgi:hypothetical protein